MTNFEFLSDGASIYTCILDQELQHPGRSPVSGCVSGRRSSTCVSSVMFMNARSSICVSDGCPCAFAHCLHGIIPPQLLLPTPVHKARKVGDHCSRHTYTQLETEIAYFACCRITYSHNFSCLICPE